MDHSSPLKRISRLRQKLEDLSCRCQADLDPGLLSNALSDATTELRDLEDVLAEDNERVFRAIFEAAHDLIFIKDRSLRYVQVNPAMEKLFCLPASELIGKTDIDLFGEDAGKAVQAKCSRALLGEIIEEEHTKVINGVPITFNSIKVPLRSRDGEISGLFGIARDVTERREMEEQLRESEERFKSLAEAVPQMIWITDEDMNDVYLNSRFVEYTGMKSATASQRMEIIHQDDLPFAMECLAKAKDTGIFQCDYRIRRHDGEYRWFLCRSVLSRDEMGRAVRWIGTATDIHDIKLAQEDLEARSERLSLAQQVAHVGTFEWNIQGNTAQWTPEFEAMYGLPAGGFSRTETDWRHLIHPEDRDEVFKLIEFAIDTGQPVEVEWRIIWPDGSIHWLTGRCQVFKDSNGKPLRMIGMNMDITERKNMEEALRESEARFRSVLETSIDAAYRYNIRLRCYDYISPVIERITGFSDKETALASMEEISRRIHSADFPLVEESMARCISDGKGAIEFRFKCKDGEYRWLADSFVVVKDDCGQPIFRCGVMLDITEHKKVEEELRKAKAVAEAASLAKSEFLANMSHEIRTPMNAIIGMAGLLVDACQNPEECDCAETIQSSGAALMAIINNILDISKIEGGKMEIEHQPFLLRECIESSLSLFTARASEKGLTLTYIAEDSLPGAVIGDQTRLRQAPGAGQPRGKCSQVHRSGRGGGSGIT